MVVVVPEGGDGYDVVATAVAPWCRQRTHYCGRSYIVTIKQRYSDNDTWTYSNELFEFEDPDNVFIWNDDWWEGQRYIGIIGITPIDEVQPLYKL